jgi:hypothetical protein
MLRDNITAPNTSPCNSKILVVPKKADASDVKKQRMAAAFRTLNDELRDPLGNSKYFFDQILRINFAKY